MKPSAAKHGEWKSPTREPCDVMWAGVLLGRAALVSPH